MLVELSLFTLGAITFPSVFRLVSSRLYMVRDDYCRLDISVKLVILVLLEYKSTPSNVLVSSSYITFIKASLFYKK